MPGVVCCADKPELRPMPNLTTTDFERQLAALTLPDHARVWIYTANRVLTDDECQAIHRALSTFCDSWAAHGQPLQAQPAVLLQQLVVLAVDESAQQATGCSIDNSVAAVRDLHKVGPTLADLDVLDRGWVIFKAQADSAEWQRAKLHDFWAMRKAGTLTDEAQVVDSTVPNLGDLRREGVKPLAHSWHAHMW